MRNKKGMNSDWKVYKTKTPSQITDSQRVIVYKKRANRGTRTPDQLITNQLLYQLSYIGC